MTEEQKIIENLKLDVIQRDARIRELELQVESLRSDADRAKFRAARSKSRLCTDLANVRHDITRALALVTTREQMAAGVVVPGREQE